MSSLSASIRPLQEPGPAPTREWPSSRELHYEERERIQSKNRPRAEFQYRERSDDWISGDEPMTGAQASYLNTLSEECDEPGAFAPGLTKAEALKRIDALKAKRRPVRYR